MKIMQGQIRTAAAAAIVGLAVTACSEKTLDGTTGPAGFLGPSTSSDAAASERIGSTLSTGGPQGAGAVYLMTNAAAGNAILVFSRAADGQLTPAGAYPTGGTGTGDGLGNQASLVLDEARLHLYAVNAGSDDISAFRVTSGGLQLIGTPVPSGGDLPISLTVHGDLLYVLNDGGDGNIAGFHIQADGAPVQIAGSGRPLSSAAPDAAQIQFNPDGEVLVVTEKGTNTITTYAVGSDGLAGDPVAHAAAGETPFGFNFNQRGDLVVSNAGGGPGGATAASYQLDDSGNLNLVSGPVATTQTAACWVAVSQSGGYAFTMNTGSGTISSLAIGTGGTLSLKDPVAGVTGAGSAPQDAVFPPGGRFLYVRNNAGTVGVFRADARGTLTHLSDTSPLPNGANGIAAR